MAKFTVSFESESSSDIAKIAAIIHLMQSDESDEPDIDWVVLLRGIDWMIDRLSDYFEKHPHRNSIDDREKQEALHLLRGWQAHLKKYEKGIAAL